MLLIIYFAFNCGLVLNSHFCGGKLISFSFSNTKNESCGICGSKKMAKNCCKDTQTKLSTDNKQINSQTNFEISGLYFNALIPFSYFGLVSPVYPNCINHTGNFYVFETGPPKTPIYIQVGSLII